MSVYRVMKKFGMLLSGHQKRRIIELTVLMILGGVFEMCSVSLVLPFMNAVMNPGETMEKWYFKLLCDLFHLDTPGAFLVVSAVILAIVYIIKNIYLLFEYNVQYRFVFGNMFEMQKKLLDSYMHRPYEFFLNVNSGEIVRIINNDTLNTFNLLVDLLLLLSELVVAGMLICMVFVLAPAVTLGMAGVMLLLLLTVSSVVRPVLRRKGVETQNASAGMNQWLLQSVQGIKEIKVMEKESYFMSNFNRHGRKYVDAQRRYNILKMCPRFMIEAVVMSMIFMIVAVMILLGNELEAIVPVLAAVALASVRLFPSVNRISAGMAAIAYNEPMLDKLIESVNEIKKHPDAGSKKKGAGKNAGHKEADSLRMEKSIEMKDLYYHYPNAECNILSGVQLVIHKGESVGIIGSSGSGKTTAADLILGLLQPQKGSIRIDGSDIAEDMSGWHRQIGYIPQMIFMLDDTIKHNVCFGIDDQDISEEKLWQALDEASLSEFVRSLPDGIDTEIGERGVRISGGQRQRIGIARVLYRDLDILVFDEATSALDHDTETAIMDSINQFQGQKTMIIIAHRLSTIEECDHIYKVENGKIIRQR